MMPTETVYLTHSVSSLVYIVAKLVGEEAQALVNSGASVSLRQEIPKPTLKDWSKLKAMMAHETCTSSELIRW